MFSNHSMIYFCGNKYFIDALIVGWIIPMLYIKKELISRLAGFALPVISSSNHIIANMIVTRGLYNC